MTQSKVFEKTRIIILIAEGWLTVTVAGRFGKLYERA